MSKIIDETKSLQGWISTAEDVPQTLQGALSEGILYINGEIIIQYDNIYQFPNLGNKSKLYIDKSSNKSYRWNDTDSKYYIIGSDYTDIKIINGGTAND
ncbi:MAG: hypothetical protein RR806_03110 [Oscillospiraceae bacterium]